MSEIDIGSLNSFQSLDETVLIAFIDENDAAAQTEFRAVASRFDHEFTFGIHNAGEQPPGNIQSPIIKCYRLLDSEAQVYSGLFESNSLESFVKEASVG